MLKAKSGDTLIFGLSERNIELLKEGRPILINLAEMGARGSMVIFYGKTEESMAKQILSTMKVDEKHHEAT